MNLKLMPGTNWCGKKLDMIAANWVGRELGGFDSEQNRPGTFSGKMARKPSR